MIPNAELGGFYLSKVAFQGMSNYILHNSHYQRETQDILYLMSLILY